MWGFSDECTHTHKMTKTSHRFFLILFRYYLHKQKSSCKIIIKLERVDDGPVLQLLNILFGLVKRRALLHHGRRALHKLHKVMTVHFVHDAEHTSAMVTDTFEVLTFT